MLSCNSTSGADKAPSASIRPACHLHHQCDSSPEPRDYMLPGVRCPTCAANGEEVWVIPGRACGYCRTPAPAQ